MQSPDAMRDFTSEELDKCRPGQGKEMEKAIYDWARSRMNEQGCPGMDFYPFRRLYRTTVKSILANLSKDGSGLRAGLGVKWEWKDIIGMDPQDWEPDLWNTTVLEAEPDEEIRTGTFDCGNCARKGMYSKNTSHYEKQTRSADEPMTIFMHCHTCKKDYRFSS